MTARFGLALALCTLLVGSASAQTVKLFDNFDSYADQGAFEAVWPVAPTTPPPAGGTNFLLGSTDGIDPVTGPNMIGLPTTGTRNQYNLEELGNPSTSNVISFSFDFYDTNSAVAPYRQFNNLQDGAANATNQLVSMGLYNNQTIANSGGNYYFARILGYTPTTVDPDGGPDESVVGAGSFFKLNDFGVGLRTTGWVNLRVDITSDDGIGTDYAFYVNNVLAERVNNVGTAASLRSMDHVRLGSGITSTQAAYVDNIKVVLNPDGVVTPTNNADFNGDNVVNGNDFLIWQRNAGAGTTLAQGDANASGTVDAADLAIWKTQFGTDPTPAAPAVAAVPEPATAGLAAVAMLASFALVRRKQA